MIFILGLFCFAAFYVKKLINIYAAHQACIVKRVRVKINSEIYSAIQVIAK